MARGENMRRISGGLAIIVGIACVLLGIHGVQATEDWLTGAERDVNTYPSGAQYNWTDNLQGIASDGRWWYVSANTNGKRGSRSTARLYRAKSQSIARDLDAWVRPLSQKGLAGCSHIGDVDYRDGTIYVAIDGCTDGHAKVGMFRRETLAYQGTFDLPGLSRAAGVAWSPVDEQLYALNRNRNALRVYEVHASGNDVTAALVREVPMLAPDGSRFRGNRAQGLKFAQSGRLYVVFDHVDFAKGGVYEFDVGSQAARLTSFMPVKHGCTGVLTCIRDRGLYLGDEIEGLLIEPIHSGPYRGDLHVLMIDNDLGRDDVYFKHYSVLSASRGPALVSAHARLQPLSK
jgi:hypothetical protein